MSFNTLIDWNSCSPEQQRELLMRPAISASESISRTVAEILRTSKITATGRCVNTARSLIKPRSALRVTEEEIQQTSSRLSDELKQAMQAAVRNIDTFHTAQILPPVDIETQPKCALPAGYPPYRFRGPVYSGRFSAAVLYRINAGDPGAYRRLQKVVLCSPPPIADEILYAAQLCGVKEVFNGRRSGYCRAGAGHRIYS